MAMAVAAFGIGLSGHGEADTKALAAAFGEKHVYRSGRLAVSLEVTGSALTGNGRPAFALDLRGPFSSNGGGRVPSFAFQADVGPNASSNTPIGLLSNGQALWVNAAGRWYAMPPSVFAAFSSSYIGEDQAAGADSSPLARAGFRPLNWLRSWELVGHERSDRVNLVHVRSSVDTEKLLGDLGSLFAVAGAAGGELLGIAGFQPTDAARIAGTVSHAQADLWVGQEDGALRRVRVEVRVGGAAGLEPARLLLDIAISQLNRPQRIEPPKGPLPYEALSAAAPAVARGSLAP